MEISKKNKTLNIVLWAAQVLLGLGFLMAGLTKSTQSIAELAKSAPYITQFPQLLVRFIGISELLGGIGLLLPSILRIKPSLTPLAALGLMVIMVLATIFHLVKQEFGVLPIPVLMGALAFFIYWGRTKKVPIIPKG